MATQNSYHRTVSVAQIDSVPDRYAVALTVDVTQAEITQTQTAHLRATATNTSDETRELGPAYYKGASSRAGDPGILLYSLRAPDSPPATYAPDCLGKDGKSREELGWTMEEPGPTSLESGDATSEELIVVDDPTVPGCIPTGTYRFETAYSIQNADGSDAQFRWGFSLRVAELEK